MKKRLLSFLLALVMVLSAFPLNALAASASDVYKETGDYLENSVKESAPTVNSQGGEWLVIGLARSGRDVPDGYYDNVVTYVNENINDKSQLHKNKSTENARVILALTAAGYDVTNVNGYNLLAGFTDMTYVKKQGINGPIWALIAFDSHNYEIPSSELTREALIDVILANQKSDGGWNLDTDTDTADSDMTGMALQALAPYYDSHSEVKSAVDKAITCLSNMQNSDGSFSTNGDATSESAAQVIVALAALGINPDTDSRFIKGGNSVVDALCAYAVDGGGFEHTAGEGYNQMATEQGYYALTAFERFKAGQTSLYDMSDVKLPAEIEADKKAAEAVDKKIEAIGTVTLESESKITEARKAYDALTSDQKTYVTKLSTLEAAEDKLAELKQAEADKEAQIAADKEAAAAVDKKIEAIGTVTLESESKITEARKAYDALTVDQKSYVTKLSTLEAAEDKLAELKQAEEDKESEEDEKPEEKPDETELPFTDVVKGTWYYDSVVYVYEKDYMNGREKDLFVPDGALTRAEFATILYRIAGKPSVRYEAVFKDVSDGAWYTDGVIWAYKNDIITGYGDGTFGTNDNITREQMAVMMYRYADFMGEDTTKKATLQDYNDAEKVSSWAEEAMSWAVGNEIIKGKNGNLLDPLGQATRAECATIIMRFEQLYD